MKKLFSITIAFMGSVVWLNSQCAVTDALGSATNMFTIGITESHSIAVNNDINSVVFIHRNNASAFGGHSGQLRYDLSTNGGLSWTNNIGVLNPTSSNGTNGARYPNVSLFNPAGNTNPNNAYLVYHAPTLAVSYNGTVSGVKPLGGPISTENYNQPLLTQTSIPRSLCKGAPGTFWAIDNIFNGTQTTGFRILKGTWNGSTDVVWSLNHTITPAFNTAYSGAPQISDFNIAFDPTGQIGWVCILSHLIPGPAGYSFYPVFYKTTDGGNTWSSPDQVDIHQFSCVTNLIDPGNIPIVAFDMDLTVDVNGNPHAIMCIGNGNNAYAIFYTLAHHMFDITQEHGLWNAVDLGVVNAQRNTFGISPNTLIMDMEPQAARTDDGTKVFFTWTGSDPSPLPLSPNLFGCGYDAVTKTWAPMLSFTSCNVATNGRILFPKMAENVLNVAGGWELPVIYGQSTSGTDVGQVSNFRYLDSLLFTPADFTDPSCNTAITFSQPDTVFICEGQTSTLSVSSPHDQYLWSNNDTTNNITISSPGTYYATVRTNCCIGYDSIVVIVDSLPVANYTYTSGSLDVSFTETAIHEDTWLWNFGDGDTSTAQNPTHTYAAVGTYNICLIASDACGTDTMCNTINVSCPLPSPAFNWTVSDLTVDFTNTTAGGSASWDFGDGSPVTTQFSPSHTFDFPGDYIVCLQMNDSCGSNILCDTIQVSCAIPSPGFTYTNGLGGAVSFTNTTNPAADNYVWDFGDGVTSTQINPNHTYASSNNYNVCLIISDTCGTDTVCSLISVLVDASVDNVFQGQVQMYPNPAQDYLYVTGSGFGSNEVQLILFNTLGQEIWNQSILSEEFNTKVPMYYLTGGVYILKLVSKGQMHTYKLLKE